MKTLIKIANSKLAYHDVITFKGLQAHVRGKDFSLWCNGTQKEGSYCPKFASVGEWREKQGEHDL